MSNVDISTVFQPTSSSVLDFLRETGQCLYIPVYQRPYSWGKENVDRLFSDVVTGLNKLLDSSEALTFIGTIICIHDNNYKTIQPIYRSQVPARVMTVIDGQQRVTSITLLNCILHYEISKRKARFEGRDEDHFVWIDDHCSETLGELEGTIWDNRNKGEPPHRFYPKIIRAIEDKWSTRASEADYQSPIGRFLFDYIRFLKVDDEKTFNFDPSDAAGNVADSYKVLMDNHKRMNRHVGSIARGQYSDFPNPLQILTSNSLSEMILRHQTPATVLEYLGSGDSDKLAEQYSELIRLLLFANYLNRNVAVTVVTTKEEDYAFDMFEALNTTGEPLSAFETFKPKIVEAEGEVSFEKSPSFNYVKEIDAFLDQFTTASARQKATADLLIPFALLENGKRIGKKLNDQRFYLRTTFDKMGQDKNEEGALEEKREFIRIMARVSQFLKNCWPSTDSNKPVFPESPVEVDDATLVCLDFLNKINHSIVIAVLSAFYIRACDTKDEEARKTAFEELFGAVKAITAFSVIWRTVDRGTRSIDTIYRDIMSEGFRKSGISAFNRHARGGNFASLSLSSLQDILKHKLKEETGIDKEASWVKKTKKAALYDFHSTVARFLLFLSYDSVGVDSKNLPLLTPGRSGSWDVLTYNSWKSDDLATVEHVAPQKPNGGWDEKIYEEEHLIDSLGNLTLLPSGENTMVGNQNWNVKRLFFKIFSSETEEEFEERKSEAQKNGVNLSRRKQDVLANSKSLKAVFAISNYQGDWDHNLIEARTENLAKLAWRYLSKWLST